MNKPLYYILLALILSTILAPTTLAIKPATEDEETHYYKLVKHSYDIIKAGVLEAYTQDGYKRFYYEYRDYYNTLNILNEN